MRGKIAKLVGDRGFGFITPEEKGRDMFFHASGMTDRNRFEDLHEGDTVEFELSHSGDRPRAINVQKC